MMHRGAALAAALALPLLAALVSAEAQPSGQMRRIGYLCLTSCPDTLTAGLRDLGWVEGRNVAIERRGADGHHQRLPDLAAELVRLEVDVIVTQAGMPPTLAAKNATRTIPIVITDIGDPVAFGLVHSLARPGGNITGLSFLAPELTAKQFELFREIVPKLSRVAVLADGHSAATPRLVADQQAAARALGLRIHPVSLSAPEDIDRALERLAQLQPDGLYLSFDNLVYSKRREILRFAGEKRIPTMSGTMAFVEGGGLAMYGPDWSALYRRSATYVDRLLRGTRPAEIPIEQPAKFLLAVNVRTAKALGLTIPPSVLIRADRTIE
jgi:putative ABC transport system substrate-binding protein